MPTLQEKKKRQEYIAKANQTEEKYGLPKNILVGLIGAESNFNPYAVNKHSNASGIAQFMKGTAQEYGINPFNPSESIDAAGKYLASSYKTFGNIEDALMSYNMGVGGLQQVKAGKKRLSKETAEYVGRVYKNAGIHYEEPSYANSVAPYLNQPTPTINYLQIPQQSPTFASAPTPEKEEPQEETDVEVQKVEQESNFLREIEKEDYAHLQPQQKIQEETPQTDYIQQYEQIGQFLGNGNEVAQQGKKFKMQDERNSVQRDATQVNTQRFRPVKQLNVRNKTDKEIAAEREAKIQASVEAQKVPYTKENWRRQLAAETAATGDKLRVSNEPNFFDDYINPAAMIGSMASNLGQAPLQAQQSDSNLPYLTAIGTPLAVGALAGLGTQNTGQFVNNLANPLAGTGDLVNNLGNKYLPNAYKYNPKAFQPNPEAYYRMIGDEGLADLQNVGYVRSNPNTFYKDKHPFFSKGYPIDGRIGKSVVEDSKYLGNNMIEVGGNNEIGNRFVKNRWADAAPDPNIFVARDKIGIDNPNLKVYQKDWLQGYKQVEVPKTQTTPIKDLFIQPKQKFSDPSLSNIEEPYISKRVFNDGKEQEVFESAFPPEYQSKMIEARTKYYDKNGNKIPKPDRFLQQGGKQKYTENELAFLSEIAIKDQEGQRNHPNKVIEIQGNTMSTHGYGDIPLYIIPNKGKARVIEANTGQHKFKGATKFLEIPIKNA